MPAMSNSDHDFHESDWLPIDARMNMVFMEKEFSGKTEFPYSSLDLAYAL